jgi:hypothetical protein
MRKTSDIKVALGTIVSLPFKYSMCRVWVVSALIW